MLKMLRLAQLKSMTGHLLGAAGGIEAVFSVLAIRDQIFLQRLIWKIQILNVIWTM